MVSELHEMISELLDGMVSELHDEIVSEIGAS